MCKYCEENSLLIRGIYEEFRIIGDTINISSISSKGCNNLKIINFCPMCGRDLRKPIER